MRYKNTHNLYDNNIWQLFGMIAHVSKFKCKYDQNYSQHFNVSLF